MKKLLISLMLAAVAIPAAPALADPPSWAPAHGRRAHEGSHSNRYASAYDNRGRYREPRQISNNDRVWRGRDGNYHCRRSNGTTGLIIGAGVGALLGRTVDTHGDRTLGTLLGAAGGGLLGREIEGHNLRCR